MRKGTLDENEIEWQRTELQTSRFSPYNTTWRKARTDLEPEVSDSFYYGR